MKKTRRDFFFTMAGIFPLFISYFNKKGFLTDQDSSSAFSELSITMSPELTQTPTGTLECDKTVTPSKTPIACIALLTPQNGETFSNMGRVSFTWSILPEADRYKLEIFPPSAKTVIFIERKNKHDRYLESIPWGGQFHWCVTALDKNGINICSSQEFSFFKKKLEPTQTPGTSHDDDAGDNGGDEWCSPGGPCTGGNGETGGG